VATGGQGLEGLSLAQPWHLLAQIHTLCGIAMCRVPNPPDTFTGTLKQIKHLLFRFFSIFFFFTKTCIHTQGMVGSREDTHTHTLTRSHTHKYSPSWPQACTPKALKTLSGLPPLPHICVYSSTFFPLAKLVLHGAGVRARVGETPEIEDSWRGQ
jgi:hypothetical protein